MTAIAFAALTLGSIPSAKAQEVALEKFGDLSERLTRIHSLRTEVARKLLEAVLASSAQADLRKPAAGTELPLRGGPVAMLVKGWSLHQRQAAGAGRAGGRNTVVSGAGAW